jgi:Type II restriction endonuclease, TdeIII
VHAPTADAVKRLLRGFMNVWIEKQSEELKSVAEDGSSPSGILAPFHEALVPGIRGLGERGFSTSLGNLHERIAVVIAEQAHHVAQRAYDLSGQLPVLAREFITQRIDQLEAGAAPPDHTYERAQLIAAFGAQVPASTRIDLYIRTNGGEDHYFEIKSAKPNKGQCIEMKQRLLTALGIRRHSDAYVWWGVPYNPYGTAAAYAHPCPARFFDFANEVKLGSSFWDFVGGAGTYEELLSLYRTVGVEYTPRRRSTCGAGRASRLTRAA